MLLSKLLLPFSFSSIGRFCFSNSNGNSKKTLLRVVDADVVVSLVVSVAAVVVFDWLEIGHGKPNTFMSLKLEHVSLLIGTFGEMLDENV
jgi:hypothetical protein